MHLINKYFKNLSNHQKEQFEALESFYKEWNEKVNVISRKDLNNLYEKHILHSLAIAKHINFVNGTTIVDVGTGGGFPGVPLAIMFPECEFMLVDSIGKKITVVQNAITELGIENAWAQKIRSNELKGKYDFVVSRAVSQMTKFVTDVQHLISKKNRNIFPNGILYLKGGDLTEELKPYPEIEIFELSSFFEEEFFETKKLIYLPVV